MTDGRHVGQYSKCHNSPTNGPTATQLGWSHHIMCPTCPPWCGCHGNGRCLATAHWIFCSHGRPEAQRREPILMKFGMQQQVRTAMTIMRLNINIFKIQNGGRPPCWRYIWHAITRLPVDRLGRNLGGHIPSCPWHVSHDAVDMATAAAYQRRIEHSAVMGMTRRVRDCSGC